MDLTHFQSHPILQNRDNWHCSTHYNHAMKTTSLLLLLLGLLAPAAPARAAEDLSAILQRGLFEEEANHDLAAAIKAYESVVSATDTQRKLAGTALFRLAECYRKLGRTNEAVTRYQRVLREYPDQPKLIELSREYLVTSAPSALTATRDSERMRQLERSLGEAQTDVIQKSALYAQLTNTSRSDLRRSLSAIFPDTLLTRLQEDQAKAEQRLPELAQAVSPNHPDFKAATALRELIQKQIDDRIDGILGRFKLELLSRQANVAQLQKELDAERQSASSERTPALSKSSLEEQRRLYQEEIAILEKDMEGLDAQRKAGVVASATVSAKQRELLTARRRLAALSPTPADGDANNAPTDEDKEVRRIQALIKDSPDLINAADQNRSTPLHRAAGDGQLVVARFLLANKAVCSLLFNC